MISNNFIQQIFHCVHLWLLEKTFVSVILVFFMPVLTFYCFDSPAYIFAATFNTITQFIINYINNNQTKMRKHLKPMSIAKIPQLHLEDKQMPHSQVHKQENIFEYTSNGEYRYTAAARTSDPLISAMAAVYFEATILHASEHSEIGVGLIHRDCDLNKHPGRNNRSIGYLSTGDVLISKIKKKQFKQFGHKCVIGVGIIFSTKQLFITLNGTLEGRIQISDQHFQTKYCPCVSSRSHGDKIQLSFKNFTFNFQKFLKDIQAQCEQKIEREQISQTNYYRIIGDYLKFYGYEKTLGELMEKEKINNIDCFTEHPFFKKKIEMKNQSQSMGNQEVKTEKVMAEKRMEAEDNQDILLKCGARQRIMSQYWGEILPAQLPRKKTYDFEHQIFSSKRKQSVLSIQQPVSPSHKIQQPTQKLIYNKQTTAFLNNDRIKIINLIREQRIQQAHANIQQKLPQLFQIHPYLDGYFRMQIYLNILKKEGAALAVQYVKCQNEYFKKYKKQLFPVFLSKGRIEYKESTYMLGLISKKKLDGYAVMSPMQSQGFANYINQLILKSLGLYSESRLDLLINHIKTIGAKAEQYQIPGSFIINDL